MRRLILLSLTMLGLVVAGCADDGPGTPGSTRTPVTTSPVTTSPVTTSPATTSPVTTSPVGGPTVDPGLVAAPPGPTRSATVLRVIDGDSMEIELDGSTTELRMIGINAPEGDECHGDVSRDTLEAIIDSAGGAVEVGLDDETTDQFGRLLGYVAAEGVDLNALMVATGNAMPLQTGHTRQDAYLELGDQAFGDGVGLWGFGVCGPVTVEDGDIRIVAIEPDPPGRDEDRLVDELVVIGNLSDRAVDLSGWTLRDESTANRFVFPQGASLAPGGEIEVRVGCGDDAAATLYWCNDAPVWSNGGDTAILQDAVGNVIDRLVYTG